MTERRRWSGPLALALACCAVGCALTSKGAPLEPRYFSPELAPLEQSGAPASPLELRLGQVESAAHLEQRIAHRKSQAELAYYDEWRWTEPPEAYVRRALERELFERRGLVQVVAGVAPTLDAELSSFEELDGGSPRVRVVLRVRVRDDRRVLVERTLHVERPVELGKGGEDRAPRIAEALGSALRDAVSQAADLVTRQLEERRTTAGG